MKKYARGFDNRTTVAVNIASEVAGEYYAVYFGNPYDGGVACETACIDGFYACFDYARRAEGR